MFDLYVYLSQNLDESQECNLALFILSDPLLQATEMFCCKVFSNIAMEDNISRLNCFFIVERTAFFLYLVLDKLWGIGVRVRTVQRRGGGGVFAPGGRGLHQPPDLGARIFFRSL